MALTDSEAADVYGILGSMLRDQDLGWLFDEVEGRAALGKSVSRRIRETELGLEQAVDATSTSRKGTALQLFTVVEPFDAHERLRLLIDAIEYGVVLPPQIAQSALESLRRFHPTINSLQFESEQDGGTSFEVHEGNINERASANARLARIIAELRTLVGR
jgi:hypothetical protein